MDKDLGLGIQNWGYYEQHLKGHLGLQLMSPESDMTKPFQSNGGFLHHNFISPEPSIPMEFRRDGWIHHSRNNKLIHPMPITHHPSYGSLPPDPPGTPTLQMLQQTDPPKDKDKDPLPMEEPKKRSQGRPNKLPKPKKPKKVAAPRDVTTNCLVSLGKCGNKSTGLVINGIDLDISGIPTPVCSCTGAPQQCYRWGIGGWQSACCTTNMSLYPLPMSTKRRGARIAGRKMSQGAFKKVLEKLAGEGYNLSNPIDLKTFWAKHGTNKFVTIR